MTPALLPTLRRVVDARAGIATRLWELSADPMTPDLFVSAVSGPSASYFIDKSPAAWTNSSVGSGAAFTREESLWSTIGETIERYSASIYDHRDFVRSTTAQLNAPTIDMDAVIGFGHDQYDMPDFPFARYAPQQVRDWVAGVTLPDMHPVYAPAQMVYLSQEWKNGDLLVQTVSSGLACHVNFQRSYTAGLLELIERDGFASAWLLRYAPPRIQLAAHHRAALSHECRNALVRDDLVVSLHLASNGFGIPNVIAFAESRAHGFGVVGASAKLSIVEAIEKAVIEVLHGWTATARARQGLEAIPDRAAIVKPHDHSLHYLAPENWQSMQWFRNSAHTVDSATLDANGPADFAEMVACLNIHGLKVHAFDLTTDDIDALGFKVTRIIVPGLQPLTFGLQFVPDDCRRLAQKARHWDIDMPATLNADPHPFP